MTNETYEMARNLLINEAAAYADETEGKPVACGGLPQEYADRWNRAFLGRMTEQAKAKGIQT